jgi:hypothetical protein
VLQVRPVGDGPSSPSPAGRGPRGMPALVVGQCCPASSMSARNGFRGNGSRCRSGPSRSPPPRRAAVLYWPILLQKSKIAGD